MGTVLSAVGSLQGRLVIVKPPLLSQDPTLHSIPLSPLTCDSMSLKGVNRVTWKESPGTQWWGGELAAPSRSRWKYERGRIGAAFLKEGLFV